MFQSPAEIYPLKGYSSAARGIKKSRLECWKDLIGKVEKDPWSLAFKIVTKRFVTKRKTPGLDNPDRVKNIVRILFPHVEPFQRQDRSSCVVQREELFILEELKQRLVLLRKRNKPLEDASSYIPICLLDTMGKLLEKMILQRLQGHMVGENCLSENQFGFRKGRSTIDAIQAVVDITTKARRGTGEREGFCALISIDISNAFNTVRWNICIEVMVGIKCSRLPAANNR